MAVPAAPADTLFEEIIDFLASAPTAPEIIAFQPPERLQHRLDWLLDQNQADTLTASEKIELDEFLKMNRFMSRIRARAQQKLNQK